MADTATRLRDFLLEDSTIKAAVGSRVYQGSAPQADDQNHLLIPFIWFTRTTTDDARSLDSAAGAAAFSETFSLEVVDVDIDKSQTIATNVRSRLNNYRGSFSDSTVKGIFVDAQADGYEPLSIPADAGFHVPALLVEVIL
jgi:hypothetical protein